MARNGGRRTHWKSGSVGAPGEGQWDVQPGCTPQEGGFERDTDLIDRPQEDNLPVQPVAQLLAAESLKESVVVGWGGAKLLQRERLCRSQ